MSRIVNVWTEITLAAYYYIKLVFIFPGVCIPSNDQWIFVLMTLQPFASYR